MKTTVNIPDQTLREVMKHTRAKTKREAVLCAIEDFNRRKRLAKVSGILGTFQEFMTQDDLKMMREEEKVGRNR